VLNEAELLKVRNFGKTSLKEVKSKLGALGLTLGMQVEEFR
jgi:DNA-directed RNA polymerase subunit alpha